MVNSLVDPRGYLGPCFFLGQKGFLCWAIGTPLSDIGLALASNAKVSPILKPRSYNGSARRDLASFSCSSRTHGDQRAFCNTTRYPSGSSKVFPCLSQYGLNALTAL
jgi:hypothetical protein